MEHKQVDNTSFFTQPIGLTCPRNLISEATGGEINPLTLLRYILWHQQPDTRLIAISSSRSDAKKCLEIQDNSLHLMVQSRSFESYKELKTKAAGTAAALQGIKLQADRIGAQLEIHTCPGTGCTYKLFLTH